MSLLTLTVPRIKPFILPEGYSWNAVLINGRKEGQVYVKDEDGCLSHILEFKNGKLNGTCEYYSENTLIEKRTFVNNVEEGWASEMRNEVIVKWILYRNGDKTIVMNKCINMDNYWRIVDSSNNTSVIICQINASQKPVGKGYIFDNDNINRVVLYDDGIEKHTVKSFEDNQMIEYNNNGNVVYKGEYLDSVSKDYPREGEGNEYEDGMLVYTGKWKNNKREGYGLSFMNQLLEYEGEWKNGLPC